MKGFEILVNPNSCNICHKDQTPEWSLDYVKKWYPQLNAAISMEGTIQTVQAPER